jgi:hypothetical protein
MKTIMALMFIGGLWFGYVLAYATEQEVNLPVASLPVSSEMAHQTIWHRLVVSDPATGEPRIILRTINGHPVIILLEPGDSEAKAVIDFNAGRFNGPKSIQGRD